MVIWVLQDRKDLPGYEVYQGIRANRARWVPPDRLDLQVLPAKG